MMSLAFDLISDLHIEDNPPFDWHDQATSRFCLVAGDVSKDPATLRSTLKKLGKCYEAVFYIDGNNEHDSNFSNCMSSYGKLNKLLSNPGPNALFLHNKVVIANDVAVLAANGWFSFDCLPDITKTETKQLVCDKEDISHQAVDWMEAMAESDVEYLGRSVRMLQKYIDVKKIIIMTHTPPLPQFIARDSDLAGTWRINANTNTALASILNHDSEKKIKAWCFGHYHWPVDETINGIRYVCNPLGRSSTPWYRNPYFAKRIEI